MPRNKPKSKIERSLATVGTDARVSFKLLWLPTLDRGSSIPQVETKRGNVSRYWNPGALDEDGTPVPRSKPHVESRRIKADYGIFLNPDTRGQAYAHYRPGERPRRTKYPVRPDKGESAYRDELYAGAFQDALRSSFNGWQVTPVRPMTWFRHQMRVAMLNRVTELLIDATVKSY